jgi:hypothetical protein
VPALLMSKNKIIKEEKKGRGKKKTKGEDTQAFCPNRSHFTGLSKRTVPIFVIPLLFQLAFYFILFI